MTAKYISLFSGIGGLEHPAIPPLLFCEKDSECRRVLQAMHPSTSIWDDICTLRPPNAEFVVGGWPCQDLSSAGTLGGLTAQRSGLFYDMLRVAVESGAHTIIGENVPNLLTINKGTEFASLRAALVGAGYCHLSWRVLNARAFGLPQERRRLFVVASRKTEHSEALHAPVPKLSIKMSRKQPAAFYWTGGKRSICYSIGYSPALKIGATDNKGRAPIALFDGRSVRKLTAKEFLRLQGFSALPDLELLDSTLLRMAGNAVPPPMGSFVLDAVFSAAQPGGMKNGFGMIGQCGIYHNGIDWVIDHRPTKLAANLSDFLDPASKDCSLSAQAAAGLIVRSVRSGHIMPIELFDVLFALTADRTSKLHPSRANSFLALDSMEPELFSYRSTLPKADDYRLREVDYEDPEDNAAISDEVD